MEVEGRKGLVDMGKSRRTWSVPTVALHLAVLKGSRAFLAQKCLLLALNCSFRNTGPPLANPVPGRHR